MGKPTSALTTAISIRIPNDLLETVAEYAQSQGFINELGRLDKRGQPNLSAAVSDLLKQALNQSEQLAHPVPPKLSDSVGLTQGKPLELELIAIENRLAERVRDTIAQQLDQFLNHCNALSSALSNGDIEPVQSSDEVKPSPALSGDSQETKEDTKERILSAASRGFRSHGYNGIGVNTLAKDAGVTSGAFYGYFRSKEDAFLATVVNGLDEYRAGVEAFRTKYGADWSVALADYYVGREHRQDLASGCALPTLSPEVIRSDRRVRSAYQTELVKLNDAIATGLATGTATEKRDTAWGILALLMGGVTLARAVWDEAVADQIATAVRQATVAIALG